MVQLSLQGGLDAQRFTTTLFKSLGRLLTVPMFLCSYVIAFNKSSPKYGYEHREANFFSRKFHPSQTPNLFRNTVFDLHAVQNRTTRRQSLRYLNATIC